MFYSIIKYFVHFFPQLNIQYGCISKFFVFYSDCSAAPVCVCVYLISVKLLDVIQNDMEESYSDDEGPVMKKSQFIDDLKVKTTQETTTFLYCLLYSRSTWPC